VDGPEFDGHKVDFENMMTRMRAFKDREDQDHHKCHIGMGLEPHAVPAAR
jgi:ferredoxin--NADP+ reductase